MINRELKERIKKKLFKRKAIIVLGPRQTGKTTLLTEIAKEHGHFLLLNCDDSFIRSQIEKTTTKAIKQIIGNYKLVFIDEAQRVKNIGMSLKLITDGFKDVQLLVSGSSALELANEINEPLTGRKWEYFLYPISYNELLKHTDYIEAIRQLENRLIFGMYPEVINNEGAETEVLKQITDSYLYKDLLSYKGIRKPEMLQKILLALAFQIGNEVSYNELSNTLQIDKGTVSAYIDLLEKAYVVFKVSSMKRNMRNEIMSGKKIYFFDNGIRNMIINNLNPIDYRNDVGALWENFMISERMKHNHYDQRYCNIHFWRTHQKQEIDYIEETDGKLHAFEFKWKYEKKPKAPVSFSEHYKNYEYTVITKDNFIEFISK